MIINYISVFFAAKVTMTNQSEYDGLRTNVHVITTTILDDCSNLNDELLISSFPHFLISSFQINIYGNLYFRIVYKDFSKRIYFGAFYLPP